MDEVRPELPMPMHRSSRCGAKTRAGGEAGGAPCRAPAMKNGRCRLHGGKSPGPPTGNRNALKHGHYSAETLARRRMHRSLLMEMAEAVRVLDKAGV